MQVWNSPSLLDRLLRPLATAFHRLLRRARPRPSGVGAHALALTPERKLILVKLRYAPGWRVPGGGRHADEELRDAVLRELREEIGMTSHGAVRPAGGELLVVEDVCYEPSKWSWEVEAVREASLDELPADLSKRTAAWIKSVRHKL
ncbi:MAG TPA: NUDIX domain-containing protein [Sphingomicrobium sp.]